MAYNSQSRPSSKRQPKESFSSIDEPLKNAEEATFSQNNISKFTTYSDKFLKNSNNNNNHNTISSQKILFPKANFVSKRLSVDYQSEQASQASKSQQLKELNNEIIPFQRRKNSSLFSSSRKQSAQQIEEDSLRSEIAQKNNTPKKYATQPNTQRQSLLTEPSSKQDKNEYSRIQNPQNNSIFETQQGQWKSQLTQSGPRYDSTGQIVNYSVVGRPEWFVTASDEYYRRDKNENTPGSKFARKWSNGSRRGSATSVSGQSTLRPRGVSQLGNQSEKKRKITTNTFKEGITKEKLLEKLENYENRIKENQKKEQVWIGQKPFFQKVEINKQRRQLECFDHTIEDWSSFSHNMSNRLHRPEDENLFRSSVPCFRQKIEVAQIIEQTKNQGEILGNKYWEATLRNTKDDFPKQEQWKPNGISKKGHVDIEVHQSNMRELSETQGRQIKVIYKKDLEIIKQPTQITNSSQNDLNDQSSDDSSSSSFSSGSNQKRNMKNSSAADTLLSAIHQKKCSFFRKTSATMQSTHQSETLPLKNQMILNSKMKQNTNNSMIDSKSIEKVSQYCSFLAVDADALMVKGENKLKSEKRALLNDGKHRYHVYHQLNEAELAEREEQLQKKQKLKKSESQFISEKQGEKKLHSNSRIEVRQSKLNTSAESLIKNLDQSPIKVGPKQSTFADTLKSKFLSRNNSIGSLSGSNRMLDDEALNQAKKKKIVEQWMEIEGLKEKRAVLIKKKECEKII